MINFLVAIVVSAIDPIVLVGGILIGILITKRITRAAIVLAILVVIGLAMIQAISGSADAVFYAVAQVCTLGIIAAITMGGGRILGKSRTPAV